MQPERWQQIKQLFHAALEHEPSGRAVFLDQVCSGNVELRSEVESLIESYEKSGEFIDAPAYQLAAKSLIEPESIMRVGQSIGSYRILSILGSGGMGEVFLAEDARLGRKVALKFLPSSYASDPERLRRFEREARAVSALNHPNILTVYEVGTFEDRQFIAAEYVEGETLRQRQLRAPFKTNELLDIGIQTATALNAAHQAGIVHRDIKPENIMLRSDGYVKVVDFGLAKLTEVRSGSTDTAVSTILQVDTDTGVVMGTTAYMSPEQTRGLVLDARTDIWSLGVVLYELLSGVMPFKGSTPSDLIVAILERDPLPLVPGARIPPELDWIVRKTLRKDREDRYQTARELLSDLRGVKQQLEIAAHLLQTPNEGTETTAATEYDAPAVKPGEPNTTQLVARTTARQLDEQTTRSRPWLALSAAFVVIALVGTGIAYKVWWATPENKRAFPEMKITRLTNSTKAIDATLSPDGKYLVYALSDGGKQSLFIRQVSTANDTMIVPPAPIGFFGITFSRDGNDLYYTVKSNLDAGTLYRIPVLGGTPIKILERIDSAVSFSPDGKQMALLRGTFPGPGESALVIANVDGSGERILATRKTPEQFSPIFFTGPSWSPDGKLIATSVARISGPGRVIAFSVADGKETDLTPDPWRFTGRVEWLPDMSGLLVIAGEGPGVSQVWFLGYPGGEKRSITNDLNTYRSLSLAMDGARFSTIQTSGLVNIWVAPNWDADKAVQLQTGNVGFYSSSGNGLSWTPDGRIVFVSNESGNLDIWIMDSAGSNRRQLTANVGQNMSPAVSHDGRFIVLSSNRSGTKNIWRMDVDGANAKRLSNGVADGTPIFSVDDHWVFYTSLTNGKPTLWKVSAEGGEPIQVIDRVAVGPTMSPDGKYVAYLYPESHDPLAPPNRIAIMSVEGGEPVQVFPFQSSGTIFPLAQWSPDGSSILYPVSISNLTNLWAQPVSGGPPKQVTQFKDSLMTGYAWSRDGKTLACTRGLLLRDAVLISAVQ